MKKIILYVEDDVIDLYSNIFSKKCFNDFKKVSMETKMKLALEGMKKAKYIKDNEKAFCLYNAYLNMAVVAENLHDIKVESVK